jgi:putative ABC transport system permease protein
MPLSFFPGQHNRLHFEAGKQSGTTPLKYLPLIWSGIWRKAGRTILVFLQVALAFALFGVLQGMKTGVARAVTNVRADVLFVGSADIGGAPLPSAYVDRLREIPGIKTVSFADVMAGTYQKPTQQVFVLAAGPGDVWLTLDPAIFQVGPKDLEALQKTRTGALISVDIGKKYGWHIGDKIPVASNVPQSNGSRTWTFDIVGTFTDHEPGQASLIVANYAYLDEARAQNKGTVRNFYAIVSDPAQAGAVSETIDQVFANSANETKTTSFRETAQQQMRSIGDLDFAIRAIVSVVLVALLFSISTMMMQSVRERTAELAVLKTLGFTDRAVFLMVVTEALVVCVAASLTGLALAMAVFPYASKFVPGLSLPWVVIGYGVIGALFVALVSVSMPALRAARLTVTQALASL